MELIGRILLYCGLVVLAIGISIAVLSENQDFIRQLNFWLPDTIVDALFFGLGTIGCGVAVSAVGILMLCSRRLTKHEVQTQALDDPDTWHVRPLGVVVVLLTFALIGWGIETLTNGQLRGLPKNHKQWIVLPLVLPLILLLTSRKVRGILFRIGKPNSSDKELGK